MQMLRVGTKSPSFKTIMNNQTALFAVTKYVDGSQRVDYNPELKSHRQDPETSKQAARRVQAAKQQEEVYQAYRVFAPCTARELADKSGIDYFVIQRRSKELRNAFLIERHYRDKAKKKPLKRGGCAVHWVVR